MLAQPNTPIVREEEDLLGQIGGLLGGALGGVSDVAQGLGEFAQQNPELIGLVGGGLVGGDFTSAAGGLISGASKRRKQELAQDRIRRGLEKMAIDRKDSRENSLRANLKTEIQDFKDRASSLKGIASSIASGTGAGDVAAITSFQKLIDPQGRVSDQDFQQAMKTAGWMSETATKVKGVWTGVKLDGKAREQMLKVSEGIFRAAEVVFDDTIRATKEQSDRQGLTVQNIIDKPRVSINIEEIIANNRDAFRSTIDTRRRKPRKSATKKTGSTLVFNPKTGRLE